MSLDMSGLTTKAQRLIARKELGLPLRIYYPPTGLNLLLGSAMLCCVAFVASIFLSLNAPSTMGIVFWYVAFLVIVSLWPIFTAIYNHKNRAVICTRGVALFMSKYSESFHWEDVLTTTRYMVHRGSFTYTVHCHDGRRIVFKHFSRIKDLAETIDVEVARAQHH